MRLLLAALVCVGLIGTAHAKKTKVLPSVTFVQVTAISLSNTILTMPDPGVVVGAVSVTTIPSGSNFAGIITLGGADASGFALTNGGKLPCNLVVGPNNLAAGTYAITLSAP